MALVINTNIASITAQRHLNESRGEMETSMERLSSGKRINSSADDAAGLAIRDRMTSQTQGINQAVRNANDAISLVQTAEGALEETTNVLQRMRELSVQASNDTYSADDRAFLQKEISQLIDEMDRIAGSTEFNGQGILDGTFTGKNMQVGADAGQRISLTIGNMKASVLGTIAEGTGTAVTASAETDMTLAVGAATAVTIGTSANYAHSTDTTYRGEDSAFAKVAAINGANIDGLAASATTTVTSTMAAIGGTGGDTYTLDINGTNVFSAADVSTALTINQVRDTINTYSGSTGVTATLSGNDLTLTAADGRNIVVTESGNNFTANTDGLAGDADITSGTAIRGKITLSAQETITVANGNDAGLTTIATDSTKGIDTLDISTAAGAQSALLRLDAALKSVADERSTLGTTANRLESTVSSLMTVAEKTSAARSRIEDADFAAESATLAKSKVLQQAGTAMLAQANASSQNVLSLLK